MSIANIIRLIILAIIIASCSGCAAIIDREARSCHAEAFTVAQMTECNKQHPQHLGTGSDILAQPVKAIEDAIQHRNHDHE